MSVQNPDELFDKQIKDWEEKITSIQAAVTKKTNLSIFVGIPLAIVFVVLITIGINKILPSDATGLISLCMYPAAIGLTILLNNFWSKRFKIQVVQQLADEILQTNETKGISNSKVVEALNARLPYSSVCNAITAKVDPEKAAMIKQEKAQAASNRKLEQHSVRTSTMMPATNPSAAKSAKGEKADALIDKLIRELKYGSVEVVKIESDIKEIERENPALEMLGVMGGRTNVNDPLADKRMMLRQAKENEAGVRANAAKELGELADRRAIEHLVSALEDEYLSVRINTCKALVQMGDLENPRAVEQLITAIKFLFEEEAANVLIDLKNPRAIESLIETLIEELHKTINNVSDADGVDPHYAHYSLPESYCKKIGAPMIVPLIASFGKYSKLFQGDAVFRHLIVVNRIFDTIGLPSVEQLIVALKDPHCAVRQFAAHELERLRFKKDGRAVEPLIVALKDEDYMTRKSAAGALEVVNDTRAVDPLISALKDEKEDYVRIAIAKALKKLQGDKYIPG